MCKIVEGDPTARAIASINRILMGCLPINQGDFELSGWGGVAGEHSKYFYQFAQHWLLPGAKWQSFRRQVMNQAERALNHMIGVSFKNCRKQHQCSLAVHLLNMQDKPHSPLHSIQDLLFYPL